MGTVLIGYFWGELVPLGTNDRGRVGAKSPTVGTALIGYFWGKVVPLATNDRGRDDAKSPIVGTVLIWYFGGELVPMTLFFVSAQKSPAHLVRTPIYLVLALNMVQNP